jgi:hypothetical protein
MFMMKRHAMKVYGITEAKHDTFSKYALHENEMSLHV